MSVRMRHTRGHTNNRRSHHALKQLSVVKDAKGSAVRLPHRVDETTGEYRGKQIFTVKVKKTEPKAKGSTEEVKALPAHDHDHDHANAEAKGVKTEKGDKKTRSAPKSESK